MILEKGTLPLHGRHCIQVHSLIDSIRYSTNLLHTLADKDC